MNSAKLYVNNTKRLTKSVFLYICDAFTEQHLLLISSWPYSPATFTNRPKSY